MSHIAILKPDHLGDLVLASPAVRAVRRRYHDVTLFVNSGSRSLAEFLFGDLLDIRCVDFPHLSRRPAEDADPRKLAHELNCFDFVFCLRDDPVMRRLLESVVVPHQLASGSHTVHETAIHRHAVAQVIGQYRRSELFSDLPIHWPDAPTNLGLCVAAGFPTNRWPNAHWIGLADRLSRRGMFVTLIGGPRERDDLRLLSRLLSKVPHRVVEGGANFDEFLEALEPVDLVVASDGGTAHICSLRKPVCSIFGSSPWRRYAPFGRDNVLLTRDELCSPCVQFSSDTLNGCMSRECMAAIWPRQVARIALSNGLDLQAGHGVRVERGVSHRYEH